ncbi:DMT family transporter [Rhodosalinus sp.]|uniref:DMT family transporter n=1 Tax=Rhodosalinus sp. TaxID=2047741 RepID=UPI00397AFA43
MHLDRPFLGVLLMLGFCILAPLGDGMAKLLGATIPLVMLLFVRFAMQAAILLPLCRATGRSIALEGRVLRLAWARAAIHIAGIAAMFTSLHFLPLADAIAIAFVMPFLLLVAGHVLMGEEVGWRRFTACVAGFTGTLMVIRPSFEEVGWPALLPLGVAVSFAAFMLVTRAIARQTEPVALQAANGLMGVAILAPLLLAGTLLDVPPARLVLPSAGDAVLLGLLGVLGTGAHLLMTWSLRFAPASTLAPMQYLEIPFATLFGWLLFRDLPDGMAAAGIVVTVASGLYIVFRERAIPAPAPPAT